MSESSSNRSIPGNFSAAWRPALLWAGFVFLLSTGLVLAVRFGADVPALLDEVLR